MPKKTDEELYATIIAQYPQAHYAFHDIDGNGVNEMIVGSHWENTWYGDAIYYLKGDIPELLVKSYSGSSGGAREHFTIYQDGKIFFGQFHSLRPEGLAKVYTIKPDNTGVDLILEQEYNWVDSKPEDIGLNSAAELDLNSLQWQPELPPVPDKPAMDIYAIQAGDYSSLIGTWKNGYGNTITFDANGYVGDGVFNRNNDIVIENGILKTAVVPEFERAQFAIWLAPSGSVYPTGFVDNKPDASDASKDRLWTGHIHVVSDPNIFYYRIE